MLNYKEETIKKTDNSGLAFNTFTYSLNKWIPYSREVHTYDEAGRLTDFQELYYNTQTMRFDYSDKESYDFDASGNLDQFYDYDANRNQWISNTKETYTYDKAVPLKNLILPFGADITAIYFNSKLQNIGVQQYNQNRMVFENFQRSTLSYYSGIVSAIKDISTSLPEIFPNPANDYLQIMNVARIPAFIEIYDAKGRPVYRNNSVLEDKIDISNLTKGIYILKINGIALKFIKAL